LIENAMAWGDDSGQGGLWNKKKPPTPEEIIRRLKEFFRGSGLSGLLVITVLVIGLVAFTLSYIE
jgi:hypothetical protein